jgi:hypothetical protein
MKRRKTISSKSIIPIFQWMFGVLLWELVTLAKQPYSGLEPYRIEEFLLKGNRLEQPMPCPQQL